MLEERSEQKVCLYYGIRSAEHYLFGDLLRRCEAELPHFSQTVYCENSTEFGKKGILDIESIHSAAPDGSLFYLSGPPAMIRLFKNRLSETGVERERIRVDDWE